MADRAFKRKFREYEDLRREIPTLDGYLARLKMNKTVADARIERLQETAARLSRQRNDTRFALGNTEFMRRRESKRQTRSKDEMMSHTYRSGFNGWQEYQIAKAAVANSLPLAEWHAGMAEWYRSLLLCFDIDDLHEERAELEKYSQRCGKVLVELERERAKIANDEESNQFVQNATPYLSAHERLCQQLAETSWIADPRARANAYNSINERIDYLRIKFELEFCESSLPKSTRDAYAAYLEEKGPELDRAIRENAPADTKDAVACAVFCHAVPIGTGRVAKTIIGTQKRLYDTLRKRERLSAYKCPDCGEFMSLDERTCVQACPSCGFHREVMVTQYEYEDYDHGGVRVSEYTYERINHLREYFRHVQGLGRKEGLDTVVEELRGEFKRLHTPTEQITDEMVRRRLRILSRVSRNRDYEKFFEHSVLLASALNPTFKVLHIPKANIEVLVEFFLYVEEGFEQIRHEFPNRKNYMGYPYVIRQGCMMIGADPSEECKVFLTYAPSFKLLKTAALLKVQDRIFERICQVRGLEFMPTVGNLDVCKRDGE